MTLNLEYDCLPTLHTKRLIIRPLTMQDAAAMFEIRSNKETMKYIPRVLPASLKDAEEHLKMVLEGGERKEHLNWGITTKESDKVIGTIGFYRLKPEYLRGEIGYILHPAEHRKGYMHEVLQTVIEYGFSVINFHTIEAVIAPENEASRNILLKNNFVKEGAFRENEYFDGKFLSTEIYTLWNPLH